MRILILNILLLVSIFVNGQSFEISCDSTNLETGDQARIVMVYKGKGLVTWRDNSNEEDTLSKAIEVVNYSKIDTIKNKNSITYRQTLMVTAWDSGYHLISPISILVNGNELKSNPLLLHYKFPKLIQQAPIKPIKAQMDTPFTFAEIEVIVYSLIIGFIVLCGLIVAILYFIRKRNHKKIEKIIPQKPLIETLTERYNILKSEKIWLKNKEKEFHSELSSILNEYLQFKYKVRSIESTSHETIQQIIALGIDKNIIKDIKHILNFSDMIKFAKQKGVNSQHEEALEILYSFLKQETVIE